MAGDSNYDCFSSTHESRDMMHVTLPELELPYKSNFNATQWLMTTSTTKSWYINFFHFNDFYSSNCSCDCDFYCS